MFWRLFLALALVGAGSLRADTVPVGMDNLFVPVGFDDNDEVEIVADGHLPNACHRLTDSFVNVDVEKREITVQPKARRFDGICHDDFKVPYQKVIALGQLAAGKWTIKTAYPGKTETLDIQHVEGKGPDNHLYAPVDAARMGVDIGGKWAAKIRGRFTNTCYRIEKLELIPSGKTLQLLPIMIRDVKDPDGMPCREKEREFEAEVAMPGDLMPGRYLLHVRSLDGRSVNDVFSNIWIARERYVR